ncbi:MAG: indolepyruvate ferredoxin oxidoreductase [marine bacterium B5-7]|nr:MAG: indolepyruvate ferredoxin oxidoreductase [marine bacterium B5-7]
MTQLPTITLDDKYTRERGIVFMTGVQALVRLPMLQRQRDAARGLNTSGFITGYRGSPLGGYDQALWKAAKHLGENNIVFSPAINEDLGATALWGTQQVNLFDGATTDGVFGIWYGKGPGVDRSGDAFKHANAAGTSQYGGVLALAGDDHTCKSSTLPHQSEFAFIDAGIPVLNPAGIQEILDFGLLGFEMSRYSGCWIAMKTIAETVDSSATVEIDPERPRIVTPDDFTLPDGGVHIRWPDPPLEQEYRLHAYKIYAALAFARVNSLNRIVLDSSRPRLGIVATGKSYLDVQQAFDDLGIDDNLAREIGIRLYKVGMPWPLEREGVRHFAEGLDEVLVVEEKRAIIENQLKEQLYNWREDVRPRVVGKFDEERNWILPSAGELTPARIARVIAARIAPFYKSEKIDKRLEFLARKEQALERTTLSVQRTPHFCSGCPHNTSTKVPEGSRAMAGIGCHYMANWMDRRTETFTQMGGEGVPWIGQSPFTETRHVFANLGDGTYYHSGLLAIRASIAAGVNITYKLLVNDAVAMTGGQPVEGSLTVMQMASQLLAEGVRRIAVVAEQPEKYADIDDMPAGVKVHGREEFPRLQLEFREEQGTTVLIYDQVCAAEKRRRRKRGLLEDPKKRVIINPDVCEGCGDCGVQSNCLSVIPLETPLGRKRTIDQSACNKDYSCLNGFCPSFVVVHGAELKKRSSQVVEFSAGSSQTNAATSEPALPLPSLPTLNTPYGIVITGVGGTGVVTVSALLGMAAHLDDSGASVLDMTGLAQKYGAVTSHVQISANVGDINAVRVAAGGADVLLGCDSVVAASFDALSKIDAGQTRVVVNDHASATAQFIANPDLAFPTSEIRELLNEAAGADACDYFDATNLSAEILGNSIGGNLMVVGFAWQKGYLPISLEAMERAIELNGVAVEFNLKAFTLGRRMAHDPQAVNALLKRTAAESPASNESHIESLDEIVDYRANILIEYQNGAYAKRYRALVNRVQQAEEARYPGRVELAVTVARRYFTLLAYKDEYEVARLFTKPEFAKSLKDQFEPGYRIEFRMAPPLLSSTDEVSGRPVKRSFGSWMFQVFKILKPLRVLRGTWFDPFGYSSDRREERHLIKEYEHSVDTVLELLADDNHDAAVAALDWSRAIRGYGPIKHDNAVNARIMRDQLIEEVRHPKEALKAA